LRAVRSGKAAHASSLLTTDEARTEVVKSAVKCLLGTDCPPDVKASMLWGLPGSSRLSKSDKLLADEHRRVLEAVAAAGQADVIFPELLGIQSATGLHKGEFCGLEEVVAQLEL
jgi:hypothetical protein